MSLDPKQGAGGSGPTIAVVGGTGMNTWPGFEADAALPAGTPWGQATGTPLAGRFEGRPVVFQPRHGDGHGVAPHRVNYRANIHALAAAGVRRVIAVAAVGSMIEALPPGAIAVPEDCIDYTWGRAHTYSDGPEQSLAHVDFTTPFAPLRDALLAAARGRGPELHDGGVIGVTQGPRLESAAEVRRLRRDGCDMVGMTTLPEAALAREAGLEYAVVAVSVNWAAGMGSGDIHGEIEASIAAGMERVQRLLAVVLPGLA